MRNFKLFIFTFLGTILIFSCSKDDAEISKISQTVNAQEVLLSPLGDCENKERFALTLSKAIGKNDISSFIVDQALRLENGDPTFLYGLSSSKLTISGSQFGQNLSNFDDKKDGFYQNIKNNDPLLSIFVYIPEKMELNKDTKFSKVYAYCTTDETKGSINYYIDGKKFTSDVSEKPSEPVIVILPNDRVAFANLNDKFSNEKLKNTTVIGENEKLKYFLLVTPAVTIDNSRPKLSEENSRTCQRDIFKQREGVQRFLFSDNLESWVLGGPEIKIDMLMLQSGSSSLLSNVYSLSNSQQGSWVLLNHKPITWFTNIYGQDYMRYHISEQDGGANQGAYTFGITIAGYGLNFSFGNNADDLYGMSDIYYCDWVSPSTWGALYYAGSDAQFWINTY